MGKSWKTRPHLNTGYPYNPIRAAHLQVLRPKVRHEDEESLFMGMYAESSGHPVFSKADFGTHSQDLKHLDFLRAYGQYYYAKVAYAYNSSCACLPASYRANLRTLESKVNNLSAPLLNGLQYGSERVLWTLDAKVDCIVRATQQAMYPKALSDARAEHQMVIAEASEARQAYLTKIEETLQFLRDHGVGGAAKHTMNALLKRLDEAQKLPTHLESDAMPLVSGVGDAWSKLANLPPVSKLLETAQPSVDYTQRKYANAHDAIVASAVYNRALEAAAEVLQRVQESPLYKAAAERLYPAISGIADPALEKIANSTYTRAVVDHLKPIPREGKEWPVISCVSC